MLNVEEKNKIGSFVNLHITLLEDIRHCHYELKSTNKLIVRLMLTILIERLKTAKNLLRKILPQPEFESGISRLTGTSVFPIRLWLR